MDGNPVSPSSLGRGGHASREPGQRSYGYNAVWPGAGALGVNGSFIPTYLRGSKYIENLEAARKTKLAAQKEAASGNPNSLSRSSSSVSLHKLAPSHRGMTYEIIERAPPTEEDAIPPLPSKWAEVDKYGGLEIAAEGLDVKYVGPSKPQEHEAVAARADRPMPSQCGIYYFEVAIISKGKDGMIGVGFSGSKASLEKLPGWESESWGYHGDDGKVFCCQPSGKSYGPKFTTGDIVGCGVNFTNGTAFFTKNGVLQGVAFRELKDIGLYPSVGMKRPQAHLSVNFGQKPFAFDIDSLVAGEKSKVIRRVESTSVAKLQPSLDEASLLKELVAQYLVHEGYVETAKTFVEEVDSETAALGKAPEAAITRSTTADDLDSINRQQIRVAILDGDIDKALKRTRAFYPQVLQDSSHIYFRLRCRKFVELFRRIAELRDPPVERRGKFPNGSTPGADDDDDDLEAEMDFDGQLQTSEDMDIEVADRSGKDLALLQDALSYGRELQNEFKDDHSELVRNTFRDIWSFYAYEDARKSPFAHLLDWRGRVPVTEELNSAILVSLGKSSSAAIERLIQQSEVLVHDISVEGGAGALINVANDFLR